MTITKQPVLSVIIPTYNIEKYLRECLDSIVNQTYENLEIIIIDDNSNDGTNEIISRIANNKTISSIISRTTYNNYMLLFIY